jgi:hypothetical protein
LTEADRGRLSQSRVTVMPKQPDVVFTHREVQIAINLTQELNPNHGVAIADLIFTDCVFLHTVDLGDRQSAGRVTFQDCEFKGDVSIGSTENVSIETGCFFRQDLAIKGVGAGYEIGNFVVDGVLNVENNGPKLLISNVNSRIHEQKLVVKSNCKEIQISSCFFKRIYVLPTRASKQYVAVHGSHAQRLVVSSEQKDCHITLNESELHRISVAGQESKEVSVKISYCKKIRELMLPMAKIARAEINYCEVGKLQIWENSEESTALIIEECTVTNLQFWRFVNKGLISLRGLAIPAGGIIGIHSSNLGETEFINCRMALATLEFDNSRLTEVFLAETDFPQKVQLRKKTNPRQAQLAFGQLRTAFDKQGDTVRALEYQAREIEAHYHDIPSFWLRKFPFLHFTKLNLGLNWLSNDFGRDWGRGVVFALTVGLICFTGLIWTTKEYSFHGHWQFDPRLIASFARFMNPLRFFDLEALFTQNGRQSYVTLTWGSYVLDFLGRVLIAYGYYQIIQAFRRFGRK